MADKRTSWPMCYPGWGEHFAARVAIELEDSRRRVAAAEASSGLIWLNYEPTRRGLPSLPQGPYMQKEAQPSDSD